MSLRVGLLLFLFGVASAHAGAFLQPEGKGLIIQQATSSKLRSDCTCPVANKQSAETTIEWGLTSFLTLFQQVSNTRRITIADDSLLYPPMLSELGLRVALWQAGPSILSSQFAVRAMDDPLRQGTGLPLRELRVMFGHSFNTALGPGFLSFAPGARSGSGRPVEGHLEVAAGLALSDRWQALGQLYSRWRHPSSEQPGGFQHRLQASLVFNPGRSWSLQAGILTTPLASGLMREHGLVISLWKRL
jgi:hypothetical protein